MKALVITVGVGTGPNKEEATKSLSHGIAVSICENNPDRVFFIASKESKEITIPLVLKILEEKFKVRKDYEIVEIKDEDDLNECFETVLNTIKKAKQEGYRVTVDFTSGTKSMSAGSVLAAIQELTKISYTGGKRVGGKVVSGTEIIRISSPWKPIVENQLNFLSKLFDKYQFIACKEVINEIRKIVEDPEIINKLKKYEIICEGYYYWDIFSHEKAKENLLKEESIPSENKEFLGKLSSIEEKEPFFISDLLNNSKRRAIEGKYDDALARLYRATELIAQYILRKKYNLDTSNIELNKITKDEIKVKLEKERDKDGKIKIGMQKSYELLYFLNDPLGIEFINNKKLQDYLKKRNESILAHGIKPITKEEYETLYEEVKKLASIAVKNLDELMKKCEFPKFEMINRLHPLR
jgi:CRISPR-associated protein (TIGR02710 family)